MAGSSQMVANLRAAEAELRELVGEFAKAPMKEQLGVMRRWKAIRNSTEEVDVLLGEIAGGSRVATREDLARIYAVEITKGGQRPGARLRATREMADMLGLSKSAQLEEAKRKLGGLEGRLRLLEEELSGYRAQESQEKELRAEAEEAL